MPRWEARRFWLLLDVPAAWGLLGVCAAATLPVAVWGFATGRFFEPLPLLATAASLLFVVRPLQLFLGWEDLYSYFLSVDPVDRLVLLDSQGDGALRERASGGAAGSRVRPRDRAPAPSSWWSC